MSGLHHNSSQPQALKPCTKSQRGQRGLLGVLAVTHAFETYRFKALILHTQPILKCLTVPSWCLTSRIRHLQTFKVLGPLPSGSSEYGKTGLYGGVAAQQHLEIPHTLGRDLAHDSQAPYCNQLDPNNRSRIHRYFQILAAMPTKPIYSSVLQCMTGRPQSRTQGLHSLHVKNGKLFKILRHPKSCLLWGPRQLLMLSPTFLIWLGIIHLKVTSNDVGNYKLACILYIRPPHSFCSGLASPRCRLRSGTVNLEAQAAAVPLRSRASYRLFGKSGLI